jgi:hypothetical protein
MQCPHKCSNKDFAFHFNTTEERGRQPQEGDCGICYRCGGWWELRNGNYIIYTPTQEEIHQALPLMAKSRERFLVEHAQYCVLCKGTRV